MVEEAMQMQMQMTRDVKHTMALDAGGVRVCAHVQPMQFPMEMISMAAAKF